VPGVSGQIGTAVVRRMLAEGWSVRGLHQPGAPMPGDLAAVEVVVGDRNDDAVLARLLGGGGGVVDMIAYNSAHARQLLACARCRCAGRRVLCRGVRRRPRSFHGQPGAVVHVQHRRARGA
jgi:hypothetical protein